MLATQTQGSGPITLFLLHWLSGSSSSWSRVLDHLDPSFRSVAIDLPGFGASPVDPGFSIADMTQAVIEVISAERQGEQQFRPWILVGHSMGAKVACAVARHAQDSPDLLPGLQAVVLLAGSPPAPEPMAESRRTRMSSWFAADDNTSRKQAQDFVEANAHSRLPTQVEAEAVHSTLRMQRAAWLAWLASGSREDWSARIGVLNTPAIVAAGEFDPDLGSSAQQALMLPHFAQAQLKVIAGARHLLPLEAPEAIAALILEASRLVPAPATTGPTLSTVYRAFIASTQVSPQTRAVLLARAEPDDLAYQPAALSVEELAILRALADRVIPQGRGTHAVDEWIDLAARIDRRLATGQGNGWRYDILPPDAEACRAGLQTLDQQAKRRHASAFVALSPEDQDKLLRYVAAGNSDGLVHSLAEHLGLAHQPPLNSPQMQRWFEEMRGELVRTYVSHPATFARLDYDGIADQDPDLLASLMAPYTRIATAKGTS